MSENNSHNQVPPQQDQPFQAQMHPQFNIQGQQTYMVPQNQFGYYPNQSQYGPPLTEQQTLPNLNSNQYPSSFYPASGEQIPDTSSFNQPYYDSNATYPQYGQFNQYQQNQYQLQQEPFLQDQYTSYGYQASGVSLSPEVPQTQTLKPIMQYQNFNQQPLYENTPIQINLGLPHKELIDENQGYNADADEEVKQESNEYDDEYDDDNYGDDEGDDDEEMDLVAFAEKQRQLGLLPQAPISNKISISFGGFNKPHDQNADKSNQQIDQNLRIEMMQETQLEEKFQNQFSLQQENQYQNNPNEVSVNQQVDQNLPENLQNEQEAQSQYIPFTSIDFDKEKENNIADIQMIEPSQIEQLQSFHIQENYHQQVKDLNQDQMQIGEFPGDQQQQIIQETQIPEVSRQKRTKDHKPKGEKKKKRKKGQALITEFYSIKKTLLTIEIDKIDHKMRGKAMYTFILNNQNEDALVNSLEQFKEFKKVCFDLKLHAKQMMVASVIKIQEDADGEDQKTPILFEYSQPSEQAKAQDKAFQNLSKDLNTLEAREQKIYQEQQNSPQLEIKKVIQLKPSKDNIRNQLPDKFKILVEYFIEKITNFGLQQNKYQQSHDHNGSMIENQESSYYFSQDYMESNELWQPIVHGTKRQLQRMIIKYIAPQNYFVVSSGVLTEKVQEKSGQMRTLYTYKIDGNELCAPDRIGFIMAKFTNIYKLNDLENIFQNGSTAIFASPKKHEIFSQNKIYEKHLTNIINYLQKIMQAKHPYSSLKLVFVPNLILRSSKKQSIDFQGGLHIFDEEILFARNQLENRNFTYKQLASSLAFDYFGGRVIEETSQDWWLLQGLRESLGNHFKIQQCGILLYRYNIMQTIESLYKKLKYGFERFPLNSDCYPHPSEQQMSDLVYQKCEVIMHMIESMIGESYYERIIRQLYNAASPNISQGLFHNIFKQVCGFKLKQFFQNWIISTSCPKLTASFNYNKKNNSLDLSIGQQSAMKNYFAYKGFTKNLIELEKIFEIPSFSFGDVKSAMAEQNQVIDSFFVELKRGAIRYFTGEVNVMIYLTDGAEIQTQQQKMSLKYGKSQVSVNIPLQCKVKKTIQNKKKEYENMLMYDQEMHQHDDERDDHNYGPSNHNDHHHIIDNMQWKFGLNDFELEEYPYGTKNLFDVKNLESPVLWIRVDPDMEFIRKVKVVQEQNNWLFQLLSEKDIIGQIEAINQLQKFNSEFVYEILKSVSVNENYFFKVRKQAIKKLQQMQTSQFNKFLKHEKYLLMIYNQRNFDKSIGFYKSNDFTKVLEYYVDKSLLKVLSKCKESKFEIKDEIKEYLTNQLKLNIAPQNPSPAPIEANASSGQITINVATNEVQTKKPKSKPKYLEKYLASSSEQIATLLLRLLKENDNSENPFDDNYYLKQILKALGNLDCFKMLPEIAMEVYRQFKLDYIGKYSPQFSITMGSISGYFKLRKQIYLFKKEKIKNINSQVENVQWYLDQIELAESQSLNQMEIDLEQMMDSETWPYQALAFYEYQTKALYIQFRKCESYIQQNKFNRAINLAKGVADFLERFQDRIDFRECYLRNEKTEGVVSYIWKFLILPFNYLSSEFTYQVKRVFYFMYGNDQPPFQRDQLQKLVQEQKLSIIIEDVQYDEGWSKIEDQLLESNAAMQQQNDEKNKHLKQVLATRDSHANNQSSIQIPKNQQSISGVTVSLGFPKQVEPALSGNGNLIQLNNQKVVIQQDGYQFKQIDNLLTSESKYLNTIAPYSNESQNKLWNQFPASQPVETSIRLSLAGSVLDPKTKPSTNVSIQISNMKDQKSQNQQQQIMLTAQQQKDEQDQQIQLMQSIQNQSFPPNEDNFGYEEQQPYEEDGESVFDEFAEIKFEDTPWMQAAWDILGLLWYHEEAGDFLRPVSEDDLGEYFEEYQRMIPFPMDLGTIKLKMTERVYSNFQEFKKDVFLVFRNCQKFNHESSEIYQMASRLENLFKVKLRGARQFDQPTSSQLRIN